MNWARLILSSLLGAYMCVDGTHALIAGSYITASTGPYAGRLGPWASVLGAAHLDPQGALVRIAFVAFGLIWLFHASRIALRRVAVPATVVLCVITLWYAPFGTLIALFEGTCALVLRPRRTS